MNNKLLSLIETFTLIFSLHGNDISRSLVLYTSILTIILCHFYKIFVRLCYAPAQLEVGIFSCKNKRKSIKLFYMFRLKLTLLRTLSLFPWFFYFLLVFGRFIDFLCFWVNLCIFLLNVGPSRNILDFFINLFFYAIFWALRTILLNWKSFILHVRNFKLDYNYRTI